MFINTPLGQYRNLSEYVEAIAVEYDYSEYDELNEYVDYELADMEELEV